MSGTLNLTIEQGTTYVLSFRWHQKGSDGSPGLPRDLTGWNARMQVRKKQKTPLLAEATTQNGKVVLGATLNDLSAPVDLTNGRVVVILTDADTDALTSASCVYDLELVRENPRRVVRLLKGKVTVDPNITQAPEDPEVGA